MKKLILLGAVAVFAVSLTSCKKDYSCKCSDADGTTQTYPLGKQKKKSADEQCTLTKTTLQWENCSLES